MRTNRLRNVWAALWLTLCGACSPSVTPLPATCEPTTQVRFPVTTDASYPTLVVGQRLDPAGDTYQSFRLVVAAQRPIHTTENVAALTPEHSFSVYINNVRQPVMVWNATAVGPWRVINLPEEQPGCANSVYEITIGTTSRGPCREIVCRGLQDTDVVQLRVDVCNWVTGDCETGTPVLARVEATLL